MRHHQLGQTAHRRRQGEGDGDPDQGTLAGAAEPADGAEQGTPIEAYTWSALFLPKATPAPVVKKLNDAAVQAINTPAVKETLTKAGAQVVSNDRATPEYLGKFVKDEIAKWAVPIKASGASAD